MGTWDEVKTRLTDKNSSCALVEEILRKFKLMGIDGMLAARSAHHLASISVLTGEYIHYVERLLRDGDKNRLAAMLTCTRETGHRMMRLIEDMGLGFEQLIGAVEMAPDLRHDTDDEEVPENSADRESLTAPTSNVRQALESKLGEIGVTSRITNPLAKTMADAYSECIQFNRELERLIAIAPDDYDELLAVLLDLQYGFDEQMRQALSDVIGSDETMGCTVGMLSCAGHYLAEMGVAGLRFQTPATVVAAAD